MSWKPGGNQNGALLATDALDPQGGADGSRAVASIGARDNVSRAVRGRAYLAHRRYQVSRWLSHLAQAGSARAAAGPDLPRAQAPSAPYDARVTVRLARERAPPWRLQRRRLARRSLGSSS